MSFCRQRLLHFFLPDIPSDHGPRGVPVGAALNLSPYLFLIQPARLARISVYGLLLILCIPILFVPRVDYKAG